MKARPSASLAPSRFFVLNGGMHQQVAPVLASARIEDVEVARLAHLEAANRAFERLQVVREIQPDEAQTHHPTLGVADRVVLRHVLPAKQGGQPGIPVAAQRGAVAGVSPVKQGAHRALTLVVLERGRNAHKVVA